MAKGSVSAVVVFLGLFGMGAITACVGEDPGASPSDGPNGTNGAAVTCSYTFVSTLNQTGTALTGTFEGMAGVCSSMSGTYDAVREP